MSKKCKGFVISGKPLEKNYCFGTQQNMQKDARNANISTKHHKMNIFLQECEWCTILQTKCVNLASDFHCRPVGELF